MHDLLMAMTLDRLAQVYEALPNPVQRALDVPIGQALNSRPATVERRPLALRVKALRSWISRRKDDALAGDVVRAYLLGPRKELVVEFLDGTGVSHHEGQLQDDSDRPDEMRISSTVESLLEDFSPADVLLYLEVALLQWPESDALRDARDELRGAAAG